MRAFNRRSIQLAALIGVLVCLGLLSLHAIVQDNFILWIDAILIIALTIGITIGLTRLKKEEFQLHNELLTQALKNRILFDEAPIAMLELKNTVITHGNQAARALLGEDFSGKDLYAFFLEHDRELVGHWLNNSQQSLGNSTLCHRVSLYTPQRPATVELSLMLQDGWENISLLVLYDVTEQAEQEARLRQSEERLELALRGSREAAWDWELDNNQMYYSARWSDMLGYNTDELPVDASNWTALIHPEDLKQVQTHFSTILKDTTERYELRLRLQHKDGHYIPVLSRGFVLRDASGLAIRISGTNRDQSGEASFEQALREDVRQLDAFIANLPGFVYRSSHPGSAVPDYISPGVIQLTGYSQDDYLRHQHRYGAEIHPDDRNQVYQAFQDAHESQQPYEVEYRIYDRKGQPKWLWERGHIITAESGISLGREGFVTDISSRKKTEQALAESEYRWKFALEGAGDGVWDWNLISHRIYYSPRWKSLLGYAPNDIGDRLDEWEKRIHPDEREAVKLTIDTHLAGNSNSYAFEHRLQCKDGSWKWVLDRGMVVSRDGQGRALRIIGSLSDITERKLMLQKLQQSESLLQRMGKIAHIGGWELNLSNQQLSWSEETYHIHEIPGGTPVTLEQALLFIPEPARLQLRHAFDTCIRCGQPWDIELPFISASGKSRWVRSLGDALWEGATITRLHGALQDITETQQIKAALQQEKTRLNVILDSAVDAIIVVTESGQIEQFNPAASHDFGYRAEEILGKNFSQLLSPDLNITSHSEMQYFLHNKCNSTTGQEREAIAVRKNGEIFPIEIFVSSWQEEGNRFFTCMMHDITERRAVQAQLIQQQKMESLSILSGGLAHDFNNLLGIITGNLDFLETRLEGDEKALQRLESALRATERGADITRRMLTLSRQRVNNQIKSPQQVNRLISELSKVLERMLGPNYQLLLMLADDVWTCQLDPAEFENALLNLTVNARDAMPDGGQIRISSRNVKSAELLDPKLLALDSHTDYIEIGFSDNGCGMNDDVRKRAFEPFFSTKEAKGTGLGLSMVYSFIKHLHGHMHLESVPGHGTTFYFYLPRTTEAEHAPPPSLPASRDIPKGHGELILVVDDEADLLNSTSSHLRELGYNTLEAGNAAIALQQLAQHPDIKLLLSDVVMPGGMFGTELAQLALKQYPDMAVLLCSGFPQKIRDDPAHHRFAEQLINKPFRRSELARRVRQALDEQLQTVTS